MKKQRLDEYLIREGFAADRPAAFVIVTEGRVSVDGQKAVSPAQLITASQHIEVREKSPYVGRGAYKLKAALEEFQIDAAGKICADIGAATGGFTQILLERGAKKVYAIDTARGKLALKLREDPRVVVMENSDVRNLSSLPDRIELASIDVSLISLRDILPAVARLLDVNGMVAALFKPQYETRNPKLLIHGIIKDDEAREALVREFGAWAQEHGWMIKGQIVSPIRGSKGNVEYLFHLQLKKK